MINALRKEIKNGTNARTKNISNTIQTARNVRKFNNSNNDSNKRTQTNKLLDYIIMKDDKGEKLDKDEIVKKALEISQE